MDGPKEADGARDGNEPARVGSIESRGPGPFTTHRVRALESGLHRVANSRRHRKRLRPHLVRDPAHADRPVPTRAVAFRRFWAPTRLAWWIAIFFSIGSALFILGGAAAAWPPAFPTLSQSGTLLGDVFILGSLFFTSGAGLQWLEVINRDVSESLDDGPPKPWIWFAWRPRNLGYLASTSQLIGTVLFNVNTVTATFVDLTWRQQEAIVWLPNLMGCLCFLVASLLAYVETAQGALRVEIRCVSWWIAIVNLLGSVAFQISAFYGLPQPGPPSDVSVFRTNAFTALGGGFFLAGAYLLIPELFDEQETVEHERRKRA